MLSLSLSPKSSLSLSDFLLLSGGAGASGLSRNDGSNPSALILFLTAGSGTPTCNILKNLANRGSLDTGLAGFSSSGGGAGGASS